MTGRRPPAAGELRRIGACIQRTGSSDGVSRSRSGALFLAPGASILRTEQVCDCFT